MKSSLTVFRGARRCNLTEKADKKHGTGVPEIFSFSNKQGCSMILK
jgi:hypothetical protein